MNTTLAFWPTLVNRQGHSRFFIKLPVSGGFETAMDEEKLNIGCFQFLSRLHKAVADPGCPGENTSSRNKPFERFSS